MDKIKALLMLIRPHQWYKNLVIFIALFLGADILNLSDDTKVILGFVSLCLVSSFNYVVNDIADLKTDKKHPEKRKRPIARGDVSITEAVILGLLLLISGLGIAYYLSTLFLALVITLIVLTLLYSLSLKKEPFLDVIMIGVNFVIRDISGGAIISVYISPWLIICTFFAAVFMALGKRRADLSVLKGSAKEHNPVFKTYSKGMLDIMLITITAILLISYSLYTFFRGKELLMITIPFALYFLLRYYHLINSSAKAARHPHLLITDLRMSLCALLWSACFLTIYYMS